jgi:hypothetical protein
MNARVKVLALAFALGLAGCGGSRSPAEPDQGTNDPGTIDPTLAITGSYVLEQINDSKPGQLVTLANPDGKVIALYRFEATTLTLDVFRTFAFSLRYTDDQGQYGIDDQGDFEQAGPVSQQNALPLTFNSAVYGDSFTAVELGGIVAIKYDFDGDGQPDTSFGFRRQAITIPGDAPGN